MCESSFEHLLTNLSLPINGLLEMWFRLLTFYIRSLNCSKKIFFSSSLVNNARSKQKIVDAGFFFFCLSSQVTFQKTKCRALMRYIKDSDFAN